MATWTIHYRKNYNTNALDMKADHKPSMEEVVRHLLQWAHGHLKKGEFGDSQDKLSNEPAELLLCQYGITVTGIVKA
ncbi:hypothetical protein [Pseudomonas sp. BN102]|uniref:hypothetical protein n=1 Tax=Pseudomonas sp. BN102 TaxID=2567886 RepID=UPI0024558760|nr:hypothetical protein [Pseudomonas sp. BN102]MDH4609050.1 hypothetical protein [Pseudomonas sp. BN102]